MRHIRLLPILIFGLALSFSCAKGSSTNSIVDLGGTCSSTAECTGELRCLYNTCVELDENGNPLPGPDGKPLVNACGEAMCGVDIFGNVCGGCPAETACGNGQQACEDSTCRAAVCEADSGCCTNANNLNEVDWSDQCAAKAQDTAACQARPLCVAGACTETEGCSDIDNDGTPDSGFQPSAEAAIIRRVGGKYVVRFVATSRSKSPPFDKIVVEIDHASLEEKGLSATGVFDISGTAESLSTCDHCVTAYTYCNTTGCFNEYYVESGTIEVIQAGTPGTTMEVKLKGLKLKEFRRDNNGKPKAFNNGKTWCMGDYAFSVLVPELKVAEGFCVEDGTGKNVADNIADFPMMNCYGEPVNLHDQCALSKVVWVVYTTGW